MSMFAPQQGGYSGQGLGGSSGGLMGFLSQLLSGYEQGHKEKLAEQGQKQELDLKKQELANNQQKNALDAKVLEAKLGQDQQTAAQGRVNAILPAIFADPSKASNPEYVQSIQDAYKQMNLPAPITVGKDGKPSVDVSGFKKDINSLPTAQIEYYQGLDPQHRAPYLDALKRQGYDVPDNLYTNTLQYTAKDQAALANVHVREGHEKAWEKATSARTRNQGLRTQYLDQLDAAKTTAEREGIQAHINEIDAKTQLYKAQIPALQQRLQLEQQRIGISAQRLQFDMQKFKSSPHSQQNTLLNSSRQALQVYNQVQRTLDDAIAKRDQMVANLVPTDDPGFEAINTQIDTLNEQLQSLSTIQAEATGNLMSGLNISSSVSASSGKNVSTVTPPVIVPAGATSLGGAPKGTRDGYYNNAKGGPVVIKGGVMYRVPGRPSVKPTDNG